MNLHWQYHILEILHWNLLNNLEQGFQIFIALLYPIVVIVCIFDQSLCSQKQSLCQLQAVFLIEYIVGHIELIFDESVNNGALSDSLISNKHYFEFYCMLFIGCVADLIDLFTHQFKLIISKISEYHILQIEQAMEIYQVSKYENIADRLKRLSNNPVTTSNNPVESQSSQGYRKYLSPNQIRRESSTNEIEFKPKIGGDYSKYLKISTIQSDRLSEQQSTTFISDLNFCTENISPQPMAKQQNNNYGRRAELNHFSKPQMSFQAFNTHQKKQIAQGEKKTLSKIKSDSNLKIDQIMESFNSYKLNKQKFLSTIGKSSVKNQHHNENQGQKTTRQKVQQKTQQKKKPFDEIENIWNGESKILDNSPKFQRSGRNNTDKYQNLADLINQITKREEPIQQTQQKNTSKFRSFIRSNTRPEQTTSYIQKSSGLNTILSPRAFRAPGKICKNNDRTFAGSIKQSF